MAFQVVICWFTYCDSALAFDIAVSSAVSAAAADNIYLAPDPDREGEAIAWHIAELLKAKQIGRAHV